MYVSKLSIQHSEWQHLVTGVFCLVLFAGCNAGDRLADEPSPIKVTSPADSIEEPTKSIVADVKIPDDRETVIARADKLQANDRLSEAFDELNTLVIGDPSDVEVLFRMATLATAMGDPAKGIELLGAIPPEHPEAGLAALGQAADWCITLHRYRDAETRYRTILDRFPNAVPVLRPLAFLLNRQGRRHEASVLIRKLCLQGDVTQDELHSLIAIGDAMYNAPPGNIVQPESSTSPSETLVKDDQAVQRLGRQYYPISPYGDARRAFQERRFTDVMELLKPVIEGSVAPPSMVALFGRAAAEEQDDAMLAWWFERLTSQVTEQADYWATLGALELQTQNFDSATRALGEALKRDPTDMASVSRMRQSLGSLGQKKEAQLWFDRWTTLRAALDANNLAAKDVDPDPVAVEQLASELEKLERPLEAILWRARIVQAKDAVKQMAALNEQRKTLLANGTSFSSISSRLCGLDLQLYPLPDRTKMASISASLAQERSGAPNGKEFPAAFTNVAKKIDLQHTYRVASVEQSQRFSIYQTLGGGVAVLDYDLDGLPDLYFAQGAADPPLFQNNQPNQLYRNLVQRVADTTDLANVRGSQYTLGVTAGDWNQDGFADIAVASIGACVVLLNNGDGTFAEQRIEQPLKPFRIPSSIAIADVTGDNLPDLLELGYIDDPNVTLKPQVDAEGNVLNTIGPDKFSAAIDYLFQSNNDGTFAFLGVTSKADARPGLGVIIADLEGAHGENGGPCNEVFIGNDTKPNRLWKRTKQGHQSDLATMLGCAYGFSGGATGAMGIAVGDFDQNSKLDLHVTNYENENANLFMMKDRSFQDRNRQYKLSEASKLLVGFGTQSIDFDNDGDEDLAVANGHLDDAKSIRGSYAQPMQLFSNVGDEFRLSEVRDPSGFWTEPHVGRALATLDFNRDGQSDLVVTQIERPSALLVNEADQGHHWFQVALVGTISERDAIGAQIEIQFGDQRLVRWNAGGDGYLCRNEQVCSFGLGKADHIDQLRVRWPTGNTQTFDAPPVDQRVLVVESQSTLFELE